MTDPAPKPPKKAPASDIDLSHWRDYDHVLTDSLWLFPNRAKTGGHRLDYHGNYIPQIATQLITRYTRADDIVLDLFLGSGTSAIEAVNLGRRCVGVDLKADLVEYTRSKLPPEAVAGGRVSLLQGDSAADDTRQRILAALQGMGRSEAQFLVLHPPYDDIIRFSELPADLSNAPSTEVFLQRFRQVAERGFGLLEPGRFAALIIGDKYACGELHPLGFWCLEQMNAVGFKTKAIIVKDIQGNEKGKGRTANLWRYRALAGGYYIFKHEYVMIFFKPQAKKRRQPKK